VPEDLNEAFTLAFEAGQYFQAGRLAGTIWSYKYRGPACGELQIEIIKCPEIAILDGKGLAFDNSTHLRLLRVIFVLSSIFICVGPPVFASLFTET
jgi:hypothetical protein